MSPVPAIQWHHEVDGLGGFSHEQSSFTLLCPSGFMCALHKVEYMTSYFIILATFLEPKISCRKYVEAGIKWPNRARKKHINVYFFVA